MIALIEELIETVTPTRAAETSTSPCARSRIRQAVATQHRRSAGRGPGGAGRPEADPLDFALWKAAKPGEPMGLAVGTRDGPAGTSSARRWRRVPRDRLRHPRRWLRSDLPPPRERDRPVGGSHTVMCSPVLDAQRDAEPVWREDGEVDRARRHPLDRLERWDPMAVGCSTCARTTASRSSSRR